VSTPAVRQGIRDAVEQEITNQRMRMRRDGATDAEVIDAQRSLRNRYRELLGQAAIDALGDFEPEI
jgi:predicted DNA-binding protein (UPF0278 family)